ncbi:MAG: Crp/Fnr family transcriptional regulator [Acidobacteria bacterium]|nr:Crp/Fnr family transcriptional regulator [Acidobacteriota bacterium]MBS1866652.1 Crp/Fnr family transcriptional regulator [Acidobacteriota bacterium]
MRGPYGFEPAENCQSCGLRAAGFFCQLNSETLKDFNSIRTTSTYPGGAVLYLEKQDPRGVFVLCAGEVKLSISSSSGKTLILRIAKPGEILGLMAVLSDTPYEVTAEALHPCQVAFIRRDDFLQLLARHHELCDKVVKQLTALYTGACEQLRTVGLSASAPEKLARLILEWSATGKKTKGGTLVKVPLTHQEIAEFLGTTRETVTRTLSDFKTRNLVTLQGSTLTISNRAELETIGGM